MYTHRFSFAHSTREPAYFGERSGRRYARIACTPRALGVCVCSGDGCKQSRRCSLCNANA